MIKVSVYLENGLVFEYDVDNPSKGREHAYEIITNGYRHTSEDSNDLEWFPPHKILKVKVENGGENTSYRDKVRST